MTDQTQEQPDQKAEEIFKFLLGEQELFGAWFGESVGGAPFFWRKGVRELFEEHKALRASLSEERQRNKELKKQLQKIMNIANDKITPRKVAAAIYNVVADNPNRKIELKD